MMDLMGLTIFECHSLSVVAKILDTNSPFTTTSLEEYMLLCSLKAVI